MDQAPESYLLPCTVVQRTCWYLERMYPGTASNNIAVRFMLHGKLDIAALEKAFVELMQRHEVLRTRFIVQDGEPKQLVETQIAFSLPLVSVCHLATAEERKNEAEHLASAEARIGFDVEKGPLFRCKLIEMGEEEFMLLLTMHHIISDGWSIGVVTNEIGEIYESLVEKRPSSLQPLSIQYGDYATWQQNWIADGELDQRLEELKQKFDGFTPISIPTDFERPLNPTSRGEIRSILLPRSLTDSLKQFSDQHGCTLFVTMLSALLFLLEIESGQSDLTIRTQTSGRGEVELESLIGWFVNSIILRFDASGSPKFETLVESAKQVVLDAFDYQHIPFERVMEVIRPKQTNPRQPPFQVNFIFQRDFVRPWQRGGIKMTPIPSKSTGTFVDLNIFLVERDDGWRASVDVNTDVFHTKTGDFLLECYQRILETVAKNPGVRAAEIMLPARPFLPKGTHTPTTVSFNNYVPPRNEHEKAIVEIWQRILNADSVGAYSNFFDLGGHSLNAVKMLAEFKDRFGLDIQLSALFTDPTPAAMAQVISGEASYSDPREIIPIQPNGTRAPFFLIGGDHWFRPLARSVGMDQPFMGVPLLKYRRLDLGKERLAVAAEVAQLLVERHGGQPFFLGGWCADGLTAFEIARAIEAKGQEIGLVVLFDAMNPDYYREARALVHSAGRTMTSLKGILKSAVQNGVASSASSLSQALGGVIKRVGKRMSETYQSDYSCPEVDFPILVIRPPAAPSENPSLGWSRVSKRNLTVVETEGDHSSIFREPHVRMLGQKLRQQLDLAFSKLGRRISN